MLAGHARIIHQDYVSLPLLQVGPAHLCHVATTSDAALGESRGPIWRCRVTVIALHRLASHQHPKPKGWKRTLQDLQAICFER